MGTRTEIISIEGKLGKLKVGSGLASPLFVSSFWDDFENGWLQRKVGTSVARTKKTR